MDIWNNIFNWFEKLLTDLSGVSKVFSYSVDINGTNINLFALLTLSGLFIYLGVAVVKWVIS